MCTQFSSMSNKNSVDDVEQFDCYSAGTDGSRTVLYLNLVGVKRDFMPLLGYDALKNLLLSINKDMFVNCESNDEIIDQYFVVFDGTLQKIPGLVSLDIDKNVVPRLHF